MGKETDAGHHFTGRTIRLFLRELLRRLDFPRGILEPDTAASRAASFAALEAADRSDFQTLVDLWRGWLASSAASMSRVSP